MTAVCSFLVLLPAFHSQVSAQRADTGLFVPLGPAAPPALLAPRLDPPPDVRLIHKEKRHADHRCKPSPSSRSSGAGLTPPSARFLALPLDRIPSRLHPLEFRGGVWIIRVPIRVGHHRASAVRLPALGPRRAERDVKRLVRPRRGAPRFSVFFGGVFAALPIFCGLLALAPGLVLVLVSGSILASLSGAFPTPLLFFPPAAAFPTPLLFFPLAADLFPLAADLFSEPFLVLVSGSILASLSGAFPTPLLFFPPLADFFSESFLGLLACFFGGVFAALPIFCGLTSLSGVFPTPLLFFPPAADLFSEPFLVLVSGLILASLPIFCRLTSLSGASPTPLLFFGGQLESGHAVLMKRAFAQPDVAPVRAVVPDAPRAVHHVHELKMVVAGAGRFGTTQVDLTISVRIPRFRRLAHSSRRG